MGLSFSLFARLSAAALALAFTVEASGQRASAIPSLDLDKLTGTWYQIAKLPTKAEKNCLSDGTVLYALNNKRDTFQIGTFCTVKGGDQDSRTASGKMDKVRDGRLKISRLAVLTRPYWVLAADPDYDWALTGTPNHKSLWVLARHTTLPPEIVREVEGIAAAQGFPVAKLESVTHPRNRVTLASPSANPDQIETPAPTPTTTDAGKAPEARGAEILR